MHLLRFLFLLFLVLVIQDAVAQNFAQVNQLPLQLNPSLAGSKGKKRISAGVNKIDDAQYTERNVALAYDELSKKLHLGIGIYYLNYKNNSHLIHDSLKIYYPEKISNNDFYTQNRQQMMGICIAPKYNIYYKIAPNKIKYTFSPSLFIETGKEDFSTLVNLNFKEYFTNTYSQTYPQGYVTADSLHSNYTKYKFNNTFIHTGIGLQLNSGKLIILSKFTYSANMYQENLTEYYYNNVTSTEQRNGFNSLQRTLHMPLKQMHL